jgi:RNA polymerase sigma-70 factor (ECF subfamily)
MGGAATVTASERNAIAQLQCGDIRGLEVLVSLYYTQALRAAYLVTHDRPLAEDLVQSAFIRAFERIEQYDTSRPFGPWFLRSVVNSAANAVTRRARSVPLKPAPYAEPAGDDGWSDPVDPGLGPAELIERAESDDELWAALDMLPPTQRAATVLHYYLEMPDADIAAQLGVPPATVRWRLHAARKRLRHLLGGRAVEETSFQ